MEASNCRDISRKIGYGMRNSAWYPKGQTGLGCGNPVALASLNMEKSFLTGRWCGFDCFLAANKVGKEGRVIAWI